MQNLDLTTVLPVLFGLFVLLIFFLIIVRRIFVNVGAREIAIKERRYLGAKMPPGRVVATEGEVGIQADVLKPGLHLIKYPFEDDEQHNEDRQSYEQDWQQRDDVKVFHRSCLFQ